MENLPSIIESTVRIHQRKNEKSEKVDVSFRKQSSSHENIMGSEDIAHFEQLLIFFSTMFS